MEALGAGASVLAFAGLGLSAAKALHTILESIKDAPENVQQARTDVFGLYSTLLQLSKCHVLEATDCAALKARLRACVEDLERFTSKIEALTIEESDARGAQYWKKLKAVLNEKSLLRMSRVVASHTAAIDLQLSALQSDTISSLPGQLDGIRREVVAGRIGRETQIATFHEQTKTVLGEVISTVTRIRADNSAVREAITTMSSLSAAGEDVTQGLLREILQQVAQLSLQGREPARVVEVQEEEILHLDDPQPCAELAGIISRLSELGGERTGVASKKDGLNLIEDMSAMLEILLSREFQEAVTSPRRMQKRICPECGTGHLEDLQAGLEAVHGALMTTRQVTLNETRQIDRIGSSKVFQSRWKVLSYDIGIGSLVMTVRGRSSGWDRAQTGSGFDATTVEDLLMMDEEIMASVSLIPTLQQSTKMVTIAETQYRGGQGTFISVPRLFVNNIRPASSPVFKVVAGGGMDEFVAMLRSGQASLRDHDEYGASLLMYAARQPEICRFLIQSGADVDYVAQLFGVLGFDAVGPAIYNHPMDHKKDKSFGPVQTCRRYLLEAGCDPTASVTIATDDGPRTAIWTSWIFDYGVPDAIRLLLDHGSPFMDANYYPGHITLLLLCGSSQWSKESFDLLFQYGATVDSRDELGRTCLHHCLSSTWMWARLFSPDDWIDIKRDGIIYLIERGADMFAVDASGESVSDIACLGNSIELGNVKEHVWDCVLAHFGHPLLEPSRGHARVVDCGDSYRKLDFERLWKGKEDLCPYYHEVLPLFDEQLQFGQEQEEDSDDSSTDSSDGGADLDDLSDSGSLRDPSRYHDGGDEKPDEGL